MGDDVLEGIDAMGKKSSGKFPLTEQDIHVCLRARTGLTAGDRTCYSWDYEEAKKCCDDKGGDFHQSSQTGKYYCTVSGSDSGTGDWD